MQGKDKSPPNKLPMQNYDIYAIYRPVLYLSRIFGVAPMTVKRTSPGKWKVRLSALTYVYGLVLLFVAVPLMLMGTLQDFLNLKTKTKNIRIKNTTSAVVTFSDVLSVTLTAAIAVLSSTRQCRQIELLLRTTHNVDETVLRESSSMVCDIPRKRKKLKNFTMWLMVGKLAHMILLVSYDVWCWYNMTGRVRINLNYLPLYGLYFIVTMFELQFIVLAWCLHSSFEQLNQEIRSVLDESPLALAVGNLDTPLFLTPGVRVPSVFLGCSSARRKVSDFCVERRGTAESVATRDRAKRLEGLSELHADLCEAVQHANTGWGPQLLVHILSILLHLTVTPYFFLLDLLYPTTYGTTDPAFLILQVAWTVTHALQLVLLVQPCSATQKQAEKTGNLVSRLLNRKLDSSVKKQLEIFAIQLMHRKVEFSICGLYVLDFPLIVSIAGSVTTYLVILIQFQNSDT